MRTSGLAPTDRRNALPADRSSLAAELGAVNMAIGGLLLFEDGPGMSYDIGWHVRRAALPAAGDDAQLAELVARELSRRLDRSRPLWELTVIAGIAGAGLLAKMHHALVDGVAAVAIGTVLLDPTPEPLAIPAPEEPCWPSTPRFR